MITDEFMSYLHPSGSPYDHCTGLPLDLQGWNGDRPIFGKLIESLKPKLVIEVGSWKGQSSATMGTMLREYGGKIICVDTWLGSVEMWTNPKVVPYAKNLSTVYDQFLSNMTYMGLRGTVIPFRQTSLNAFRILSFFGIRAQLIYLDGSHEYRDVSHDIAAYWALLDSGGVMFGDDYSDWPGVVAAVGEHGRLIRQEPILENPSFWRFTK